MGVQLGVEGGPGISEALCPVVSIRLNQSKHSPYSTLERRRSNVRSLVQETKGWRRRTVHLGLENQAEGRSQGLLGPGKKPAS